MRAVIRNLVEKLREFGHRHYERVDRMSGGILGIFWNTIRQFSAARGPEAAASMAYYAIFSLFPLVLSLIAIGSTFIEESRALKLEVYTVINAAIPVSADLIIDNIDEILDQRNAVGAVGAAGLLWSASGVFTVLFHNINRAWAKAAPINILKSRLFAMGVILIAVLLLVVALFSGAFIDLLPAISISFSQGNTVFRTLLWLILSNLIPITITFAIFFFLYWRVPNTHVKKREAFWASLLAAVSWEVTTHVFTWYLSSGLATYEFVYGTLGTLIALLFWIYLNSTIVIFCAHLSAVIANQTRPAQEEKPMDVNPAKM